MPHPPEKVWRALTEGPLIEEWLMKNDFQPVVDHRFQLCADWGSVDCQVLAVEPNKTLSYTWAAFGLESVVTWTLSPTSTGTHLRMEQSGFRPDQQQAYQARKPGGSSSWAPWKPWSGGWTEEGAGVPSHAEAFGRASLAR